MLKDLFRSRPRYATISKEDRGAEEGPLKKDLPSGLWQKCQGCGHIVYSKDLETNQYVCTRCSHHFIIGYRERLRQLVDKDQWQEWDANLVTADPLNFPKYTEKTARYQKGTGLKDAVVSGLASIDGQKTALVIIDYNYMRGSMNAVVGEKIVRAFDRAVEERVPLVLISGGGGGARMEEGILSLMQMARTSQAVERHSRAGLFYIAVLTEATMGGIYGSFASLADIIIAEPGALIGFAGPRIIEQTMRQKLPEGFQRSEYVLEHGMIDKILPRAELRSAIADLLKWHGMGGGGFRGRGIGL